MPHSILFLITHNFFQCTFLSGAQLTMTRFHPTCSRCSGLIELFIVLRCVIPLGAASMIGCFPKGLASLLLDVAFYTGNIQDPHHLIFLSCIFCSICVEEFFLRVCHFKPIVFLIKYSKLNVLIQLSC